MDSLKELTEQGQQLGYTGEALQRFVKEQQDIAREERLARRRQEEKAMGLKEMELKVMEREKIIIEQNQKLQILEQDHRQRLEMLEATGKVPSGSDNHDKHSSSIRSPKLPPFDEKNDEMDSYLRRFERYATAHSWDKDIWATHLSALLKGKALDVYARLPVENALNYDMLKSSLLKRFDLTEDGFRNKFRNSGPEVGETFAQYACRLEGYLDRWIEMSETVKTFEQLHELIVKEQVMSMCSKDLVLFLKEHVPKGVKEVTDLADQYREARDVSITTLVKVKGVERKIDTKTLNGSSTGTRFVPVRRPERRCYRCGKMGHIASDRNCPRSQVCNAFTSVTNAMTNSSPTVECKVSSSVRVPNMPTCQGLLEGNQVTVLRDTGCSGVIVKKGFVNKQLFTGGVQRCGLADGTQIDVPVAEVYIDTPYFCGTVTAWCMDTPLYDVILGNIDGARDAGRPDPEWTPTEVVNAVQTRQQAKAEEIQSKYKKLLVATSSLGDDMGPEELQKLQQNDGSLTKIRKLVADGLSTDKIRFFMKNDLIYREFSSSSVENGKTFLQLVVPESLRTRVMRLGHESVMSGHLGCKRTAHKVLAEFYWPGVQSDIKRFCQSCDACQRTIPRGKVVRAPLGKMPLIEVPFQRVAVDLVGPIEPRSAKGNRYILTLIDYASRYPEAVALPSIEAERVAEALLEMFCRLGVPAEMLTDMGSQFTSEVMREVSRLLSLKQLTTTPYHPICNGLVEKLNGTLKLMIKRLCIEKPKDWDRYLGPVLFAFRDAPQESLGFTPFELIYGRSVRGPMSILRELWTKEVAEDEVKTSYQYVVDLQERLEQSYEVAHSNLEKASARYAKLYNRRSRAKKLKAGQRVLVLLPTKKNKLLLQWKGPYKVIERVGDLDYRVEVQGKVKMFHANMLKLYVERDCQASVASVGITVIDENSCDEEMIMVDTPTAVKGSIQECKIDDRLTTEQTEQMRGLLEEFQDVLSSKPGITNIGEHDIKITTDVPIRSKQYPIPFALKQIVIDEVKSMLDLGVIEPSESEYCSNFVIVKKSDGSNRFCIDFRPLNRVTVFDCEPMPNMEDIFVKLTKRKYLSKIDLTKGYWQLPLNSEVKHLTAFQTPLGLFQFRTMPFGLVCASASFTRVMRRLLQGLEDIDNFIDDVMVYTETFEQHLVCLRSLFQRLRQAKLTAKPSKCHFCFDTIECLGHVVGNDKLEPLPDKLESIREAKRPETKKQVRAFLGLIGFYRKFINNFATLALPLTNLTQKAKPNRVAWEEEHEQSFQQLKQVLCKDPILKLPEIGKPFILQTDACDSGIGSVLLQLDDDGCRKPVAYASRKLNKAEKRYATVEKECLAIVWAINKFQRYLYGVEFSLETDHKPLSYLSNAKLTNARLMRWALLLQPYKFRIVAIPGKVNIVADSLSRL